MAGGAADRDSSVARLARLLDSFDGEYHRLTLTEIAARSGLAASTAHRMLGQLVKAGLLAKDGDARYTIGRHLWELGETSPISLELRETALPWLLTVYEVTAENVHFAILDGIEALYVARLVGPHSVPTMSRMGGRLPLHTTGVGKALLAWQSEEFLERYFARPLERPTKFSVTSEARLRTQLRDIRNRGYSVTHQEQSLGNTSLAVPVPWPDDVPIASVGLVTHTVRADIARLVPVLQKAAVGIATDLASLLEREGVTRFH
ncbi:MAG TPA: IclR family transcriptional regulator [Terrimesophilobacter sp.]|jgi:Transcriptional regulator|uniref:IclR family transcriptional regulator n=1 Tax=Terrimesophilobacter sp. TaxID=2906435 RepID=UPI002F939E6D